jgi:hypothetical protein
VRNPAEAVKLAQHANDVTAQKGAAMLDTLAAAYAANGDFARAVQNAQKAFRLATAAGDKALAAEIDERVRLYLRRQAFVDNSLAKTSA